MIAAVQNVAYFIGKWGCYFLCILRLAEKAMVKLLDPFYYYILAVHNRYMRDTCFVDKPGELLASIVGGEWVVLKAGNGLDSAGRPYDLPLAYVLQPGEFEVDRWEKSGDPEGHFILPDGWDPYGKSQTVANGKLVSRRIFRKV